jgi:hypothetical protein
MKSDKHERPQGLGFPALDEGTHANTSVQNSRDESQNLYFVEATSCLCVINW